MAQSVPPGDIQTQPNTKIVFNAPYDDKHTYHIKIINAGGRRIGWAIKTTNMKRLGVDPPAGVLDPKEAVLMAVSCDAFAYGQEDTNNDRITIEWTNTPDGAAKQFRREWFQVRSPFSFKAESCRATAWFAARTCPSSTTPERRPPPLHPALPFEIKEMWLCCL